MGPPTSLTFTTDWTTAENARLLQSAAYLGQSPAQLQKTGVQLLAYLLALQAPQQTTPLSPPPDSSGPVAYATTWFPRDIGALGTVDLQFQLTPVQSQKAGVELIDYLLQVGGH